jgi:hypothetical protein
MNYDDSRIKQEQPGSFLVLGLGHDVPRGIRGKWRRRVGRRLLVIPSVQGTPFRSSFHAFMA